ncbi:aminotransferase class V-fold PLP-dependent enzyme [Clostridium sp. 19966]|uniref:aminotransferase class V-fold PLP-dependent enzyme n=1 Tax=Clostridium sp. 19966 TaxID=2768166 RepID=UPI0028E05546|nr:aminotransferase class V-fold PLP-dependent enzyme [Clostridium sp. 19966]MDT8719112.1 aminotransferase class V-fold PLP-dependent enzyme [Clostridium sp. 19966]
MDYRDLIAGVDVQIPLKDGRFVKAINFDNAATTPPFISVVESVVEFSKWYSSIHRGVGYKSKFCSEFYEDARERVLKFVGAGRKNTVIFVKNSTEALNKLSYRLIKDKDWVVLSTFMEHHSNDLPWRDKCIVDYIDIDEEGKLLKEDLIKKLEKHKGKVKFVTVTGASNVTGYVNDIDYIAEIVHKNGAKLIVDGAQLAGHKGINMKSDEDIHHIDYLVFSAHKMYAPFGIGAIVGPKESFEHGDPEYKGGGTVDLVTKDSVTWDEPPYKEEAGTPNIMGVSALVAAMEQLSYIGMNNIESYENIISEYTLERLKKLPYVTIYGHYDNNTKKVGIITFNINNMYHQSVAKLLSENYGIALRDGCFCAQPYMQRLLGMSTNTEDINQYLKSYEKPGAIRISFGLYNNILEVDYFINSLNNIYQNYKRGLS